MAKQLNVDVNLNTAKAEAALKNLQQLLTQAIQGAGQGGNGTLTKEIVKATQEAAKLKTMLASATDTKTGQLNLSKLNQQLQMNGTNLQSYSNSLMKLGPAGEKAFLGLAKSVVSTQAPVKQANTMLTQLGTTLKNTARWQLSSSMLHAFIGGIQNAFSYARGLNDSLNSIRIVTGQSAEQMDKFAERANKAAKTLSTSTLDYTDAALIYYQQGIRDDAEIKARTDATIKMANVTGQSAQKVSEQMTAIWNNFADGSTNLEYFADVITALGANTASSSAEISQGLQKFAAVADTVGLSYEYATSALATVVATTRQSADVVGTALKTLFARIQSLNLGETLDDGTTLGKYSKALDQVGISIKDQNGELRSMDDILDDMGAKWEILNKDQQVALAQTVAGQRQYTQLVALMDNWDFMKENLQIAYDSEGTLEKQQEIYEESWKAAKERVKASMQGLTTDLISDDFFIGFNDILAKVISGIDTFIDSLGGLPGLFGMIGVVATKVFGNQLGQQMDKVILKLKELTGIAKVETTTMQQNMANTVAKMNVDSTGAQRVEAQAIQRQIHLSSQLLAKKESLTQADINQIQALIEVGAAYDELAIKTAQQAEQAELNAQKQVTASQSRVQALNMEANMKQGLNMNAAFQQTEARVENYKQATMQLQEMITASEKVKASLTSLKEGGTGIQALYDGVEGLIKSFEQAKFSVTGLKEGFTELKENRFIQEWIVQTEAYKQALEEVANLRTKLNSNNLSERERIETIKALEMAEKNLVTVEKEYQAAAQAGKTALTGLTNTFEGAANAIDSYLLSLIRTRELTAEEAVELRNLVPGLQSSAEGFEKLAQAEEKAAQHAQLTQQALDKLKASATVSAAGKSMVSALGAVSSLAMGISSLKGAIDALNNSELSFGEKFTQVALGFSMGISMMLSGIMQIGPAMKALGLSIRNGFIASLAASKGMLIDDVSIKAADGTATVSLAMANEKLGFSYSKLAAQIAISLGLLLALAATIAAIIKATKEAQEMSPEGQVKIASEQASEMSSALQDAKSAAEELNSAFDKYDSVQDKLKSCTKGTQEWTEALRENNNQVLELLTKYPQLASMDGALIRNENGSLAISKSAENQMKDAASQNVDIMNWGNIVAQQQVTAASQNLENLNLAKDINTEMQKGIFNRGILDYVNGGAVYDKYSQENAKFQLEGDYGLGLFGKAAKFKNQNQEAIGRREEGGNAPGWAQPKDAETVATEAIVKNFNKLSGKTGEELTKSIEKIFDQANISADASDWAQALEKSGFREELIKNSEAQIANQKAQKEAGAAMVQSELVQDAQFKNNKNLQEISSTLGSTISEATKNERNNLLTQLSTADNKVDLGRQYAAMIGGNADSVMATSTGIKFKNAAGEWDEATSEMIASALAAANALENIPSAAQELSGLFNKLDEGERKEQIGSSALKSLLSEGDLGNMSYGEFSDWNKFFESMAGVVPDEEMFDYTKQKLIDALGGEEEAEKWAKKFNTDMDGITEQFLDQFEEIGGQHLEDLDRANFEGAIAKSASMREVHGALDQEYQDKYGIEEVERVDRGSKSYEQLSDSVDKAKEMQKEMNVALTEGAHLTDAQVSALKEFIGSEEDLSDCIDTSNGNLITNAEALENAMNKANDKVAADLQLSKAQEMMHLEELTQEAIELADMLDGVAGKAESPEFNAAANERLNAILEEIDSVEGLIAQYSRLEHALLGAESGYERIAKAKEKDAAKDYSDDATGALNRWYELDKDKFYGTEEFQEIANTFVPEEILQQKGRRSDLARNYLTGADGNGFTKYFTNDGKGNFSITQDNIQNFVQSGIQNGLMEITNGVLQLTETGTDLDNWQSSLKLTGESLFALFSQTEKFNEGDLDLFSQLSADGSDVAASFMVAENQIENLIKKQQTAAQTGDWDTYYELNAELDKALGKLDEIKKKASQKVQNYANTKFQADAANNVQQQIADTQSNGAPSVQVTEANVDYLKNSGFGKYLKGDQKIEVGATLELDSSKAEQALTDVQQDFEHFKGALETPTQAEIELGAEAFHAELERIKKERDELENNPAKTTMEIDGVEYTKEQLSEVDQIIDNMEVTDKHMNIECGTEQLQEADNETKTLESDLTGIPPKTVVVHSNQIETAIGAVGRLTNAINNIPDGSFTISYTYEATNSPPSNSGGGGGLFPAFGTAQAYGNAYEAGTWGTGRGPLPALVGELGQELVVDPANGRYYTVGDVGAEFTTLPKNAIIFNHKQTEQLLKYRKINTRGQALVQGNAFDGGSDGWYLNNPDGSKKSNNNTNNNNSNNTSSNNNTKTCFVAGTLVALKDKQIPIEELLTGDVVLSYNEQTKENEYSEISKVMTHNTTEKIYTIYIENKIIQVTGEHPFYVYGYKTDSFYWKKVSNMRAGDQVLYANGEIAFVHKIESEIRTETVYNLEVANNHNYYVGENKILVHNKGGAAAASNGEILTYEQQLLKILYDEVDVYSELNRSITRLEHAYKNFTRNNDRLWGKALLNNIQNSIDQGKKLFDKEYELMERKQKRYQESLSRLNLTQDLQYNTKVLAGGSYDKDAKFNTVRTSISDFSIVDFLIGLGHLDSKYVTRDKNNKITDIDTEMFQEALVDYYNSQVQETNQMVENDSGEETKTNVENIMSNVNAIVELGNNMWQDLVKTEEEMLQQEEATQDILEEIHDLAAELITQELEMRLQIQDNHKKLLDFQIKRIGNNPFRQFEKWALRFDPSGEKPLRENGEIGILVKKMDAAVEAQKKATDQWNLGKKDPHDKDAISQKNWEEITQKSFDEIMDNLNELVDFINDLSQAFSETAELGMAEIEKYTGRMEATVNILNHMSNLLDLTGRKYDYAAKKTIIEGSMHNLKNAWDEAANWADLMSQQREASEAHYQELLTQDAEGAAWYKANVLDKSYELEQDALEKMYSAAEDYLNKVEELWQVGLEEIMSNWEEAATKGEGWDFLSGSMSRAKSIQEEYLTTTNKLYETNTLMRKVQQSIDKTDSKISKEKLASFNKEIEAAQKKNQLSVAEMEILKARYELLEAQLALEEAKEAKSIVRLQRDSEGNYGYVYTADQDDVDDKEQAVADKENDLYNLVLGYQNENQEKRLQIQQEYTAAAEQLWNDYYNKHLIDQDEYERKLGELKQQASDKLKAIDSNLTQSAYWLNQVAAEGVSEAWAYSYADRIASTEDYMDAFTDASNKSEELITRIDAIRDEATQNAQLGLTDVSKKTEELTKKNDELKEQALITADAVAEEMRAVDDLTASFAAQYTEIQNLIDAYYALAQAMAQALEAEGPGDAASPFDKDYSMEDWDNQWNGVVDETWDATRSAAQTYKGNEGFTADNGSVQSINRYTTRTAKQLVDAGMMSEEEAIAEGKERSSWLYKASVVTGTDVSGYSDTQLFTFYHNNGLQNSEGRQTIEAAYQEIVDREKEKSKGIAGAATGMYTGEWGSEGKLAILHEKELVLNKDDTVNFLNALNLAKELVNSALDFSISNLYQTKLDSLQSDLSNAGITAFNSTGGLEQEVHITAEFPNATDHNEIEQAFTDLVNRAAQYASVEGWAQSRSNKLESSAVQQL